MKKSPIFLYVLGGFALLFICVFAIFFRHPSQKILLNVEPELSIPSFVASSTTPIHEDVEMPTPGTDVVVLETATPALPLAPLAKDTSTQLVVLAFDGSRSLQMWKDTRNFAKEMAAAGAPVHFSYFINTVYLLANNNRNIYLPPRHATGTSPIGFATNERDVANRLEQMNGALSEGHEIGCHLTGHYNGSTWTEREWRQEFASFFNILQHVSSINHLEQEPLNRRSLQLPPEGIIGFRAPELGVNAHLWPVLSAYHFQYDTSLAGKPGVEPVRLKNGLWEFPLEKIPFAGSATSSLLSMDYNFYFKQSQAHDVAKKGTPLWDTYYNQVLTSYRDYFTKSYEGNHAPLFIGHHFSLWNDGVYWEALKTFARETCGKPHVRCVSYKEVLQAQSATSL